MTADTCPRDSAGFCRLGLVGHPRCMEGSNWCRLASHTKKMKALWRLCDRLAADERHKRQEREGK